MMPFETVEGELKVLVYRGGDDAKIRARCAKGSQRSVSANACGGAVIYSGRRTWILSLSPQNRLVSLAASTHALIILSSPSL
jgi:hypothetical protein